jgi:CRISPR-associated protein Cas5t
MQQIHPSFQMPPPATIYGHICSALGEWVDPTGLQFAYHFTYQGVVKDVEHIIVLSPGAGKLPGSQHPKVLEGNVNPFDRELLFQPRLTLYLNRPEWEANFRRPHYAVVLGRSQDLFTYTQISVIEVEQAARAYFEHTILPHQLAVQVMQGVTVLLPRYLDYAYKRTPTFSRYLVVKDRVLLGNGSEDMFTYSHQPNGPYWIDPASPTYKETQLGLYFHSFTGGDGETLEMA